MLVRQIKEQGRLLARSEGHQFRSGYVILEPGKEVGEHKTEEGEEFLVLLEGTARVTCAGEVEEVDAPAVVLIPAHTMHNMANESYKLLKYVYTVAVLDDKQAQPKK
jgi:quercetin dioxygenase-like cupin family protein